MNLNIGAKRGMNVNLLHQYLHPYHIFASKKPKTCEKTWHGTKHQCKTCYQYKSPKKQTRRPTTTTTHPFLNTPTSSNPPSLSSSPLVPSHQPPQNILSPSIKKKTTPISTPNPPPMATSPNPSKPHFLIITFPAQGHLNPALHLAKRLSSSADVTFSTSLSAHQKMFPSLSSSPSPIHLHNITYLPFSDGSSVLPLPDQPDHRSIISQMKLSGSLHLASTLRSLASSSRPVTCLLYTIMLPWAADVARAHQIPTALFWIQSANVLAVYHHFFNGHQPIIAAHKQNPSFEIAFPSLPRLRIRDLPSFLTIASKDEPFADILDAFRELFEDMAARRAKGERPRVMVNSFEELEAGALSAVREEMEVVAVGPVLVREEGEEEARDIFEQDEREYMEWLDAREERLCLL